MEPLQELLTVADVESLVYVKLCLFGFVAAGLLGIYKKFKAVYFLSAVGIFSAAGFYFLIEGTDLMFWGLTADEITIGAMYEMFAHGSLFADFAYADLPPFYPPFWFQVFGFLGGLLKWNGVQIAKLASFSTILTFPIIFYLTQKLYWGNKSESPGVVSWFLSSVLIFIIVGWNQVITKPYEFVTAALAILWTQFLLNEIWNEGINYKKIIIFGVTGGVIFLSFYFWFFLIAIGIALFNLFYKKVSFKKYLQFSGVAIITLVAGSFYWLPLVRKYNKFGAENWQLGFWVHEWINTSSIDSMLVSISGILMLVGIVSLIFYRKRFSIRVLLSLFSASFVWFLIGLFAIGFYHSPMQGMKGFEFFNKIILALSAGYGIEQLWKKGRQKLSLKQKKSVYILGVMALSTQLLFGNFVNQEEVKKVRVRAKDLGMSKFHLKEKLKNIENIEQKTVLQTGMPQLHSFVPFSDFIYFNQHNSHPAANFSKRERFLTELSLLDSSKKFYDQTQNNSFDKIDLFMFYSGDKKTYPISLHIDDFPNGIKEKTVRIPKDLFDSGYFNTIYEGEEYVIIKPTNERK